MCLPRRLVRSEAVVAVEAALVVCPPDVLIDLVRVGVRVRVRVRR